MARPHIFQGQFQTRHSLIGELQPFQFFGLHVFQQAVKQAFGRFFQIGNGPLQNALLPFAQLFVGIFFFQSL